MFALLRFTFRPSWVASLACVVLASASVAVRAQDAEGPSVPLDPAVEAGPETSEDPAAPASIVHALLVEAVAEYDAGRYAEAQVLFRRANEMAPSGRTLRGLGMASFELREYAAAVRALEAALVATARPLTDEQRAHAVDLLGRARGFVAHVEVRLVPVDATVHIDGIEATRESDGAILVDAGRHVVTIEHAGFEPETINLSLDPGVPHQLAIALRPVPTTQPAPPPPPPTDDLAWAGAGLGIAAALGLAVSATTGIVAVSDRAQLDAGCDVYVCPVAARTTRDRVRDLSTVTDVIGTASAIVGTAGIVLLVLAATSHRDTPVDGAVSCTSDGCTAVVRGVF